MKAALTISLAANLGLAALVLRPAHRAQIGAGDTPVAAAGANVEAATPVPQAAAEETPPGRQPQFRWSQLESPDYRAYISNLAAIGCPRQTIRDIITADVDSLYAPRRKQIEAQAAAGSPLARANAQQMLDSKLQALYHEEASVLTALLGSPPGAVQPLAAGASVTPARTQRDQTQDRAASMPLAFQNVDPAALKLNDEQLADINYLRYSFQQQIGGPNQDPNDPAYLRKWQAAQPQNDLMLHRMLGTKVYEAMQNPAGNQTAPAQ